MGGISASARPSNSPFGSNEVEVELLGAIEPGDDLKTNGLHRGIGMGPVGFEPTTKGFTLPRRFRREWTISSPVHRSGTCGCGMLQPVIKGASALR